MDDILVERRRNFEVYETESKRMVKLYHSGLPKELAEEELRCHRTIRNYRVESPFVYDLVERDGRYGIMYDRVTGIKYLDWIQQHTGSFDKLAKLFAYEHHEIHANRVPELVPVKTKLDVSIQRADLPEDLSRKVSARLRSLPDGEWLVHMDFQPENIVIGLDGPVTHHWAYAAHGDYLADVANTSVLLEIGAVVREMLPERWPAAEPMINRMHDIYIQEYIKICNRGDDELERWRAPVAAARLAENVPEERDQLLGIIERSL